MGQSISNWFRSLADTFAAADVTWFDVVVSLVILAVALLIAALFSKVIFKLLIRLSNVTSGDLDDRVVSAARGPITAYIILLGLYLALTVPLPLPPSVQDVVNKAAGFIAVITGAILINALGSATLRWLQSHLESTDAAGTSNWALPLARRGMVIVVFAMAGMVSLDILGINISPLIAGLGIGGLAVALALQPTLSNLFAGTYVITEGVVNQGDYIEMEGGVSGYVVDVNWRSTRLRTWSNNLVIIPNSRFAETIITNYSKPDAHVNVYLTCGVAYESDLQLVETVSQEVMRRVLTEHPGAVRSYGAYFGYDTFGESNIDFWLFMQAGDRLASFEVRSELVKQLHARLNAEGITINYPVRTLRFPEGWASPDGLPMPAGAVAARESAMPVITEHAVAVDTPVAESGGGDGPGGEGPGG
jgi:small-conductance mechanosensitive channel